MKYEKYKFDLTESDFHEEMGCSFFLFFFSSSLHEGYEGANLTHCCSTREFFNSVLICDYFWNLCSFDSWVQTLSDILGFYLNCTKREGDCMFLLQMSCSFPIIVFLECIYKILSDCTHIAQLQEFQKNLGRRIWGLMTQYQNSITCGLSYYPISCFFCSSTKNLDPIPNSWGT